MSVRHAILALLASGPAHGYELKADFEAATGSGWPLNIGQVYSTLQRCERDGLATPEDGTDSQGRRPWSITAAGREFVTEWFDQHAAPTQVRRDEFSLKALIVLQAHPSQFHEVIRNQRQETMSELQELTRAKAQLGDNDIPQLLQVDRSILLVEAQVRWLDMVEARVETAEQPKAVPND